MKAFSWFCPLYPLFSPQRDRKVRYNAKARILREANPSLHLKDNMTSHKQKPKQGETQQGTALLGLFLSPLHASLSIFSPCMTPNKCRNPEQHSLGEFKLLIKLNYSWKQFLNYPLRLPARARTLHLQVLLARLSPPKPSYQRSWCQGVCAKQCRVLRHWPYRRPGQLSCFLTSPELGRLARQKN